MKTTRRAQASKRKRWEKSIKDITNKVMVIDGNFEQAFRKFKRKVRKNGIRQECRDRMHYIKPAQAKQEAKKKAIRREQKRRRLEVL